MSTEGPNDPTPDPLPDAVTPDAVPDVVSEPVGDPVADVTHEAVAPNMSGGAPPKRRISGLKRVIAGVVAAIVAFFAVNAIRGATDSASKIKAGECVVRDGENGIKTSSCDANGAFKVIKKIDDTTVSSGCLDPKVTSAYSQERGSNKFVLCLGAAK